MTVLMLFQNHVGGIYNCINVIQKMYCRYSMLACYWCYSSHVLCYSTILLVLFEAVLSSNCINIFVFFNNFTVVIQLLYCSYLTSYSTTLMMFFNKSRRCYPKVPRLTLGSENEMRYRHTATDGTSYMPNEYVRQVWTRVG